MYRVPRRQVKHRRQLPLLAERLQNGPAVELRQQHVEDDEVILPGAGQVETVVTLAGDIHDKAVLRQPLAQKGRDFGFVFHDENAHRKTSAWVPALPRILFIGGVLSPFQADWAAEFSSCLTRSG